MQTQYDHLKEWTEARIQKLDQPLNAPDRQRVIKDLDIITGNKGSIPVVQLEEKLPAEQVNYLKQKMPEREGNLIYREFNPFPQHEPVVLRRQPSTLAPPSVNTSLPVSV